MRQRVQRLCWRCLTRVDVEEVGVGAVLINETAAAAMHNKKWNGDADRQGKEKAAYK